MQRAETGLPHGFRRTVGDSGLILPEDISREREVWTRSEWKLMDRVFKLLESRGLSVFLQCQKDACKHEPIQNLKNPDGGYTLRCAHRDRVFQRFI